MGGPNSINSNNPIHGGGYNPGQANTPDLKEFALTIDDFRQFASGKYNAGIVPGERAGIHRTWERLESPDIDPSEAASIRLAFAFALEDAGVSGDKMAAVCKRLGLEADFSFSDDDAKVYTALSREEVRDIIAQSLGGKPGRVEPPKAEVPQILRNVDLGPLLPEDGEGKIMEEPPKVVAGGAKNVGTAAIPKIKSQEAFVDFVKSLTVTSEFGTVSEDAEAKDVNGNMKKTFTYTGLVFRLDDRGIDHPTMADGFTSKNELALSKNKTEAMGLGSAFINNDGEFVTGEYGISGESGVSTAKTIDGCIQYRHGKCSLFVIDTSKLPKGEKAWDMERTLYGNGYREKNGDIDETKGEVNVSFIPRSAIVGWVEIADGDTFADIKDNGKRLEHVQNHGRFVFNAGYQAD